MDLPHLILVIYDKPNISVVLSLCMAQIPLAYLSPWE
jgi:hypothetical protein